MPNTTQLEREEEQLDRDLESGLISQAEYKEQLRELHQSWRADAEEAAWGAYENEMNSWY